MNRIYPLLLVSLLLMCGCGPAKLETTVQLRTRAEEGDPQAAYNLGVFYLTGDLNGEHTLKDGASAAKWLRMAAEKGVAGAQGRLGSMYFDGDGVPRDYLEAMKWFRKAADQNDPASQYMVGDMYVGGFGVPEDQVEGLAWVNIAASAGYSKASDMRDTLEAKLGRENTIVAQQRSKKIVKEIESAKAGGQAADQKKAQP